MSKIYELNEEEAFAFLVSRATAHLRASYEWVPSIAGELARQGSSIKTDNHPGFEGAGWMFTVDYGAFPFIDVPEDASFEELDYEEAFMGVSPRLCGAHKYAERFFKRSWVPNKTHEILGSEEVFRYARSIELSDGAARLHERLSRDPQLLQKHLGVA